MENKDYISHHGILGQKWGIRRYQNSDGSLTSAGRRKAQQLKNDYKSLTGKKIKGKIPKESPEGKPVRKLNDTDLQNRIKRLSNEKQALGLERDLSSNGQKFVRSIGKDILAPAAINAGKNLMEKVFFNAGAKALGLDQKVAKDSIDELRKATEISKLKKEKYEAERWMKNRMDEERKKTDETSTNSSSNSSSAQNKQTSKDEKTVNNFNFFVNESNKKQYTDNGRKIIDATYKDVESVDQLLENKKKGK